MFPERGLTFRSPRTLLEVVWSADQQHPPGVQNLGPHFSPAESKSAFWIRFLGNLNAHSGLGSASISSPLRRAAVGDSVYKWWGVCQVQKLPLIFLGVLPLLDISTSCITWRFWPCAACLPGVNGCAMTPGNELMCVLGIDYFLELRRGVRSCTLVHC